MNSLEKEYNEILEDMLHGPPQIFVAILNYQDGSSRAFTFSIEENLAEFIKEVEECAEAFDIVSYVFYDSLLDVTSNQEYTFWTTEH